MILLRFFLFFLLLLKLTNFVFPDSELINLTSEFILKILFICQFCKSFSLFFMPDFHFFNLFLQFNFLIFRRPELLLQIEKLVDTLCLPKFLLHIYNIPLVLLNLYLSIFKFNFLDLQLMIGISFNNVHLFSHFG